MHTLAELLVRASQSTHGISFVGAREDKFVLYETLHRDATQMLGALQACGMQKGEELVIFTIDNQSLLTCFWAGVLGGMVPVPLSAGRAEKHLDKLVNVSKSLLHRNLVVDSNLKELVSGCFENTFDEALNIFSIEDLTSMQAPATLMTSKMDDTGFIQFSSGSTGNPKGIALSHKNLYYNTKDIYTRAAITDKDVLLSWMPLTHDMGMICCHLTGVAAQANQVLFTTFTFIKTPLLWMEKAHEYRATMLYSPNFGYQYFLQALAMKDPTRIDWDLSCIRLFFNGAEMISSKICKDFVSELASFGLNDSVMYPGYGLAEASVAVCLPRIHETYKVYPVDLGKLNIGAPITFSEDGETSFPLVSLGYPLDHTQLRITDSAGELLPEGHLGHIQITGRNVMQSYYDDIHNQGVFTSDGWLRTGDLGFLYKDELVMAGREKNLIIINGQNYIPDDIENTLANHTGITKDKLIASSYFDPAASSEALLIFIVHKTTAKHQEAFGHLSDEVKALLNEKFGLVAKAIVAVRQFPKTTSGKVKYSALVEDYRQSLIEKVKGDSKGEPAQDLPELVKSLLFEITGKTIDEEGNAIVYFLDSLLTIQFVNKLREAGYLLDTTDIYKSKNLREVMACIQPAAQYVSAAQRRDSSQLVTLNQSQRRFYLLHQLADDQCALNNIVRVKIDRPTDRPMLEKAAQSLLDTYPVLSGHIAGDSLRIGQVEVAQVIRVASKSGADAYPSFNLEEGPLWQIIIGEEAAELWFIVHHIISDGWSLNLLLNTFFNSLNDIDSQAVVVNQNSFLPAKLSANPIAAQKQYWQTFLSKTNFGGRLNASKPLIGEFRVAHVETEIDSQLLKGIYALAEETNATPYIISLSAVFLAIHQLTAHASPTLATNIAAREKPELQDQVGLFMRTLLIKENIDPALSYAAFIAAVKLSYLQTLENRDYHYDEILALKKKEFETLPDELFEILVLYQKFGFLQPGGNQQELSFTDATPPNNYALSNITCEFIDKGDQLILRTSYRKGLYETSKIEVLNAAIVNNMSAMTSRPDLPIMSAEPNLKSQLLGKLSGQKAISAHQSVLDNFNFAKYAEQTAIASSKVTISYQQLDQWSSVLASKLITDYQLADNPKVVLLLNNSAEFVISVFAVWKANGTFVPIDISYPQERIRWMIEHCDADLVITDAEHATLSTACKKPVHQVTVQTLSEEPIPSAQLASRVKRTGEALSYIMYTSGTTGTPKGVMVQDHSVANYIGFIKDHLSLTTADKVIQQSSVAFDTTIEEIFPILSAGGTLVMYPSGNENVSALVSTIDRHQVTVLSTTPLVISEINKRYFVPKSLRILISGGDYLKPEYLENIFGHCEIYNSYGPTETTVCATYHKIDTPEQAPLIGSPVANCAIHVVDEHEELVSKGTEGEIVITGAGVARGYYKNQSQSREKFIPNTFDNNSELAYKTGDLGLIGANDRLSFIGRKDRQLKVRGYRVELLEIEQVYIDHNQIEDAIAHVSTSENKQPVLLLYYTGDEALSTTALHGFGEKFLPFYMLPAQFLYLPVLPRTRNGKIDLKKIKALTPVTAAPANTALVEDDLLALVRKSWKTALETEGWEDHKNLFEGGGNSLIAVRIASVLGQGLKKHVPLKWLYAYPTIAQMADHIRVQVSTTSDEIEPKGTLTYPLSLSQERLFYLCRDENTSIAYNESQTFSIAGELNIPMFKQAFAQVVQRHALLRSVINTDAEVPVWKVYEEAPDRFALQVHRLADNGLSLEKLIEQEAFTAFNFTEGPLYRFKLIEIETGSFVLSAVMHHLISDGATVAIFFNEWKEHYNALKQQREPTLAPLSIQFGDYVQWQRKKLTAPGFEETDVYWKQKLSNVEAVAMIPADRPAQQISSFEGNRLHFELNKEEHKAIRQYCKTQLCTPFVFFSAILGTLVYKYTGKRDILITYPDSGRDHHALKDLIGFFVNTLLLRASVTGEQSFFSLVQQLSEQRLNDTFHLDIPFERLTEYADVPPADLLNNIVLVMQDEEEALMKSFSFDGLHLEAREKAFRTTKGNIVFFVEPMPDGSLLFDVEYDTSLFDQERITRYFSHIKELVNGALQRPFVPIAELDILPEQEKQFVLFDNNATEKAEALSPTQTVVTGFQEQASLQPEGIAITQQGRHLTFLEVNETANRIARHLQDQCKVAKSEKVAIVQERAPEFLIAVMGVLKAGCTYVPIDPDFPQSRIEYLLTHSDTSHILSKTTALERIEHLLYEMPTLKSITCIDQTSEDFFEEMEQRSEQLWDYTADIATNQEEASGWVNSFTKEAFSATEINDLIYNVVDQVKPLVSEHSRVLEVGCGSGLIMFNLYKEVKHYVGTDISDAVIKQCQTRINEEGIDNVKALKMSALEVDTFEEASFDAIVLNSVVQYFTHQYLRAFLLKAMKLLKPGGHLFIADVRDLSKQRQFYELLCKGEEDQGEKVKQLYLKEDELFLNQAFFEDFFEAKAMPTQLRFTRKKETIQNELTRFRYNVLVTNAADFKTAEPKVAAKRVFHYADLLANEAIDLPLQSTGKDIAYILYTSGTSGTPKGVPISHEGIYNRLWWTNETFDFRPGDALWQKSPASFDVSVWEMLFPLTFGYRSVICPKDMVADANALINYIADSGITHAHFVPSLLNVFIQALEKENVEKIKQLRVVFSSGEELLPSSVDDLKRQADLQIYNLYGPTEASVDVTYQEALPGQKVIPIGKPISNTKMYIFDADLNPLPLGIEGDLYIAGIGLTQGYYKNEALTREKFLENPHLKGEIIYKTGDSAYLNAAGEIIYTGRTDNQIKLRGFRIELGEIEWRVSQHPAVKVAQPFTMHDQEEKSLCMAIVPDASAAMLVLKALQVAEEAQPFLKELPDGKPFYHPNVGETEFMFREIYQESIYMHEYIHVKAGDTIIDAGANGGMFCTYLSCHYSGLRYFTVEPIPVLNQCIRWNASLYGLDLTTVESGLYNEERSTSLVYYVNNTITSHLADHELTRDLAGMFNEHQYESEDFETLGQNVNEYANEKQRIDIQLTTLSKLILTHDIERVDLLKLDVEGSELKVLEGLEEEDWAKIKQLIVEVENKEAGRQVMRLLRANGFQCIEKEHPLMAGLTVNMIYAFQEQANRQPEEQPALLPHLRWTGKTLLQEVIDYAREHLPDYMIPDRWLVLDHIPVTRHGKADRKKLINKLSAGMSSTGNQAANQTETNLLDIWKDILGVQEMDVLANFFQVGGHSLKATKLMIAINRAFGSQLRLSQIFEYPTIRDQAGLVIAPEATKLPAIEAVAPAESYELSRAQQRFWIMELVEANTYASNMPGSVKFTGALDIARINDALNLVIKRHESLRTVFPSVKGVPRQVIAAPEQHTIQIELIDLSAVDDPLKEARDIALQEAKITFDLTQWPLFKTKVLRIKQDLHVLLFTVHHIVSDGRSLEVIVEEMMAYYNAMIEGEPIAGVPLKIQYKDFAAWQNRLLNDDHLMAQEQYWISQFEHVPAGETIATDYARPETFTTAGANLEMLLANSVMEKALQVRERFNMTEFGFMYGIINLVVLCHSQKTDLTIGVPFSTRDHGLLEDQIGNYLNLLPIRSQTEKSMSFRAYMTNINQVVMGALANNAYPFDLLVEKLDIEQHRNRMPLFDIGFTFNHANKLLFEGKDKKLFKNLTVELFENTYQSVKADLWFNCYIQEEGYKFNIEYNSKLFSENRIREIIATIGAVIDQASAATDVLSISEIIQNCRKIIESQGAVERGKVRKKNLSRLMTNLP